MSTLKLPLSDLARYLLAAILAAAALTKLFWPDALAGDAFNWLSAELVWPAELLVAVLLLSRRTAEIGFVACSVLVILIAVGALVMGPQSLADCGCFGAAWKLSALEHGLLLIAVSGLLFVAARGRLAMRSDHARTN